MEGLSAQVQSPSAGNKVVLSDPHGLGTDDSEEQTEDQFLEASDSAPNDSFPIESWLARISTSS
jgi:hypothetical protein